MALGDRSQAFTFLNQALHDRSEHVLYLGLEPLVDPLRNDSRFDSMLQQVGLPQRH